MWSLPGAAPLLRDWGPGLLPGAEPRGRPVVPPSLACRVGRLVPPFIFRSSFIPSSRFLPPALCAPCRTSAVTGLLSLQKATVLTPRVCVRCPAAQNVVSTLLP